MRYHSQCTDFPPTSPRIPELDKVVFTSTGDQALERMPLQAFDIPPMALHRCFLYAPLCVEHLDGGVIATADPSCIVWREAETSHRFAVRVYG